MNIITGYRGEPHITSAQDRAQNQGSYGTGSYILDVGQQLAAEIVSANEVRIRDGVLSHQGCVGIIEQGAYDSLEIANGSQGMQRIDLIVARYTKNSETNVESLELVVIEGTAAASNPTVPSYNTGDIQAGDSPVDMPLYRVNINGVNIASTTLAATKVQTQAELQSAVSELNSNAAYKVKNILSEVSSGSLITLDIANYYQAGNIGALYFRGSLTSALTKDTNYTNFLSVPAKYVAPYPVFLSFMTQGIGFLPGISGTTGTLNAQFRPSIAIASGTTLYASCIFITNKN